MLAFEVTDAALDEIERQDAGRGRWCCVMVLGGGCNGFRYHMTWRDPMGLMSNDAQLIERVGKASKVYVDPKSRKLLYDVVLDFDVFKGFMFDNPNAKSSCGCGQSFGT